LTTRKDETKTSKSIRYVVTGLSQTYVPVWIDRYAFCMGLNIAYFP